MQAVKDLGEELSKTKYVTFENAAINLLELNEQYNFIIGIAMQLFLIGMEEYSNLINEILGEKLTGETTKKQERMQIEHEEIKEIAESYEEEKANPEVKDHLLTMKYITNAQNCLENARIYWENLKKLSFTENTWIKFGNPNLISPTPLQKDRFKSLNILYTKAAIKLYNDIMKNDESYSIKGPAGIGKSHALLMAILRIRKEVSNCRMILLNNFEHLIAEPIKTILFEVMYAFYNDNIMGPNEEKGPKGKIWQMWERHCLENKEQGPEDLIKCLKSFCETSGYIFYIVTNQVDVLNRKLYKDELGVILYKNIKWFIPEKIICASLTNEPTVKNGGVYIPVDFYDAFTEEEAKKYISTRLDDDKKDVIPDEAYNKIYDVTSCVPFELEAFYNFLTNSSLEEAIDLYLDKRIKSYITLHNQFLEQNYALLVERKIYMKEVNHIVVSLVEDSNAISHYSLDERLIIEREGPRKLYAVCKVAQEALLKLYEEVGNPYFKNLIAYYKCLSQIQEKTASEIMLGKYVITCLKSVLHEHHAVVLKFEKVEQEEAKVESAKEEDVLAISIKEYTNILYIRRAKTVEKYKEQLIMDKNALYLPFDNFPNIDLLYIDTEKEMFIVGKGTKYLESHSNSDKDFLLNSTLFKGLSEKANESGWKNWKVIFCWIGDSRIEEDLHKAFKSKRKETDINMLKIELEKLKEKKKITQLENDIECLGKIRYSVRLIDIAKNSNIFS